MSFIDKLPQLAKECEQQLRTAMWNRRCIEDALMAEDHDCDCQYCDQQSEKLVGKAREEKEKELVEATHVEVDLTASLRSIQGYAKLVKVDLRQEK